MPKRTGRPWQRRKAAVIRRDLGICWLCGGPGADSADHLIPWAHGGTDHLENLRAVHHSTGPGCNRVRGDRMDIAAVRAEIAARLARTTPTRETWEW